MRRVQSGQLNYSEAVKLRMYRPLGQGDVDVPAIVGTSGHSYGSWYTLEQDTILTEEPKDEGLCGRTGQRQYLRTVFSQLP